ncbi:MAG: hypothetical protein U5N56_05390 [Candidatus Marinimicrobia bacterium]|nr:hypothetical protein [Candidatus Neomarinimicrobiota bacterium]
MCSWIKVSRKVKESGIGTYQVFQESYHPEMYDHCHPSGPKNDFNWRLTSLDRAMEGGIDDLGIGALFGLYGWRYEVLDECDTNHFEADTTSVPTTPPHKIRCRHRYWVMTPLSATADFLHLIAVIRLAVPYTGMILTAREPLAVRKEAMRYGVSQTAAPSLSRLPSQNKNAMQNLNREQFEINDPRSLNEIIDELLSDGYLPSFS